MHLTLKEWRRLKNISQEKMAEACGIHVNTYRAWEDNPADIKLSKAVLISELLGVDLSDIIFMPIDTTKRIKEA